MRLRSAFFACAWILAASHCAAASRVFTGNLERIGHESIAIKLADRTLIEVRLPTSSHYGPEKLAAQYHFGDRVEIKCKEIPRVWDEESYRLQFLELTQLHFLRAPTDEELLQTLASRPWRGAPNLLQRPAAVARDLPVTSHADAAAQAQLDHVRQVNLAYARSMPNFMADETATRYSTPGGSKPMSYQDTVESEITFQGNRALRRNMRRDGQPWNRPQQELPGFIWYGGFGTEIVPVFDSKCPTTMESDGESELRGARVQVYRFNSPVDGCFGTFSVGYQRFNPARSGRAFVASASGNVIELEEEANGFPPTFGIAERREEVRWELVKIGEASYLLPVHADFQVLYATGERWHLTLEYKNHRHFESSSNIDFQ